MANVQLTYEEMRSAANRLKAGEQEITEKLTTLQQMIGQLVTGPFKMESASGKFGESYTSWNNGAKQTIAGLKGMQSFIQEAMSRAQQLDIDLTSKLNQSS